MKDPLNYPVGGHCYENFFTNEELCDFEKLVEETEAKCSESNYLNLLLYRCLFA